MKEKSELALRLIELRKSRGETAQEVAEAIGIKSATYRRYEIDTQPRLEILCDIARHFGVSVDSILQKDSSDFEGSQNELSNGDIYHVRNEIITLSAEEALLVKQCRRLSQEDFAEVMRYVAWRKSESESKKNNDNK